MVDPTGGYTELEKRLFGSKLKMLFDRSAISLNSILVAFLWRIIKYISRQNDDYLLSLAIYELYSI